MASSTVNLALSLLEPTLASNGEPTPGRWGRDELTYGRPTLLVGQPVNVVIRPQT